MADGTTVKTYYSAWYRDGTQERCFALRKSIKSDQEALREARALLLTWARHADEKPYRLLRIQKKEVRTTVTSIAASN